MQQRAGGEAVAQAVRRVAGELALVRPEGGGVPFGAVRIVDGDEGGFAAHGEADVAALRDRHRR